MKVGDYVRTEDGFIGKITTIENNERVHLFEKSIYTDNYEYLDLVLEESIAKSSPNIIDLIEVGDYVNGRIVDDYIYLDKLGLIGLTELEKEDEKFIKSIVTKQQFESMEYKVGE